MPCGPAYRKPCGRDRPPQRVFVNRGGVGITRPLAAHRPQPEPFGRVIAGGLDTPVIQNKALRPAPLDEQFAVVGPQCGLLHQCKRGILIQMRVKRAEGIGGHMRYP